MHPIISQAIAEARLADDARRRRDHLHEARPVRHPVREVRARVGRAVVVVGHRIAQEAVPRPRGIPPDPV